MKIISILFKEQHSSDTFCQYFISTILSFASYNDISLHVDILFENICLISCTELQLDHFSQVDNYIPVEKELTLLVLYSGLSLFMKLLISCTVQYLNLYSVYI